MGVSQIKFIKNNLIRNGLAKNTPILIVSNASRENQIVYKTKLIEVDKFIANYKVKPPSIIIIK